MTNVPAPLVEGSKLFPVTPVPEKVPPTGVPFKATGEAVIHIAATGEIVTTGNGFTVIEVLSELVHPFASV